MIGQQIGPYNILNLLGQGDIGMVYQAVHSKAEQMVAIKVLSPELCVNAVMRDRVLHQANRQAGLFHPNVVNVLKYLKDSHGIYLVMEYVKGESLEKRLNQVGPIGLPEALRIALKVLEAMAFMHKRGIHHRHLKPSDILIIGDGNIKVKDFGITKVFGEKGISLMGIRLKSLGYMSPEQLQGETVDAASDIYSLGVTLYQMLTGQLPIQGKSRFEVMKAHMEEVPRDPAAINPALPKGLCDIIMKTLAKNPQDRFQSAKELAVALLPFTKEDFCNAVIPTEGPPPVQRDEFVGSEASSGKNDAAPSRMREDEPLFPIRFDRRVLYLLMGTGMVLIGVLMHLIFFRDFPKEDLHEENIPTNFSPADRIPSSATSAETVGDESEAPQPQGAIPESTATEAERELMATPPFPQDPFVSGGEEISLQPQPAPSVPAVSESDPPPETVPPETFSSGKPAQTDITPKKTNAIRKNNRPTSKPQSRRSATSPENRRSSEETVEPPERENHGWRIIK